MISEERLLAVIKAEMKLAENDRMIIIGKQQALNEIESYIKSVKDTLADCTSCKWENVSGDKLPCVACSQRYLDRWEKADNA